MQAWQPIVPSHELEAERIVQAFANGIEFALWRSTSGGVQAWENRCAHRSVRLTLGRIIDDRLVCGYHGWRYAPGGQCTLRPAHPGEPAPKGLGIKTFPAVEAGGMVWVAPGGDAVTPPEADSDYTVFCRTFVIRCDAQRVATSLETPSRWKAYVLASKPDRTTLHVWCRKGADIVERQRVSKEFKALRERLESA